MMKPLKVGVIGCGWFAQAVQLPILSRLPEARSLGCRVGQIVESLASIPYLYQKLRSPWHEPSYREALARFISAIRERQDESPDLIDGYCSLEVIAAAEKSAKINCGVDRLPMKVLSRQQRVRSAP